MPTAPVFFVSTRRWTFPFFLSASILPASLAVLSKALDPLFACADLPKSPSCTDNRHCSLACHAAARALAHIAPFAASGPRQRASPRSVRSTSASPASRGSGRSRLPVLMVGPERPLKRKNEGSALVRGTFGAELHRWGQRDGVQIRNERVAEV